MATLDWLEQVKKDAEFNHLRRLREQQEKENYEKSKAQPVQTPPKEDKKK